MRLLVFIIGFVIAILILRYRLQIKDAIGDVGFAEKYLGVGGTHVMIVFIAIAVFVISLTYATGTLQGVLDTTLGGFFGR